MSNTNTNQPRGSYRADYRNEDCMKPGPNDTQILANLAKGLDSKGQPIVAVKDSSVNVGN